MSTFLPPPPVTEADVTPDCSPEALVRWLDALRPWVVGRELVDGAIAYQVIAAVDEHRVLVYQAGSSEYVDPPVRFLPAGVFVVAPATWEEWVPPMLQRRPESPATGLRPAGLEGGSGGVSGPDVDYLPIPGGDPNVLTLHVWCDACRGYAPVGTTPEAVRMLTPTCGHGRVAP